MAATNLEAHVEILSPRIQPLALLVAKLCVRFGLSFCSVAICRWCYRNTRIRIEGSRKWQRVGHLPE